VQDTGELGLGAGEQIGIGGTANTLGSVNVGTYGQSLSQAGLGDKNPFSAFGLDIYTASVPTTKDEAKKGLAKQFSKEKLTQSAVKFAGRMIGMPAPLTSGVMGFVNGVTVNDPLGNPSFRPSHPVFGLAHDLNMSIQFSNASAINAAINANLDVPYAERGPIGFMGYDPTNGQLISRAPLGKTWTGTSDLSVQQKSALEALSKGFTTNGYNNITERGEVLAMGTDTIGGQTVGGYDNSGFHHSINGASRTGTMAQAQKAATKYGIPLNQFLDILNNKVRKNLTFFGKPKNSKLTLDYLSRKQFRDNETTGGSYSMGLETDVTAQQDIENALSQGIGVNEFGGISAQGLTDVQGISQATQGITSGSFGTVSVESPGDNSNDGGSGSGSGAAGSGSDSGPGGGVGGDATGGYTAFGGQIGEGMQEGGPAGFIGGPPENYSDQTTIADDIPLEVKDGTFVINAPAVEYAGSDDISEMLTKAYEKAGQAIDKSGQRTTIPSKEQINIMISRGEVVVPPQIAKIIGYDRLEKINNRGKKEVARRQKQGDQEKPQARQANEGGFINKDTANKKITLYRGDKFPEQYTEFDKKYMKNARLRGAWFSSNKAYARMYGQLQKTLTVSLDEYLKGSKRAEIARDLGEMRSDLFNPQDPKKRGSLGLTKEQRQQLFKHVKEIKQFAKLVKEEKIDPQRFVNTLHMSVFPEKKDEATIRKIESYKNNPKLFAKLVVRNLANNIVAKGTPFVTKAIPGLSILSGFAPKEMGDATLSGKEGFIYDYRSQ
jgi:hypothetical protein